MRGTKAHGHLIGSVAPPIEPIDLRYCDVDGQYVRTLLMQKLYHLQKLSESNKTPRLSLHCGANHLGSGRMGALVGLEAVRDKASLGKQ